VSPKAGASFSKLYAKKIQFRPFFRQANPRISLAVLSVFKGLQASLLRILFFQTFAAAAGAKFVRPRGPGGPKT
jgi:hypothetical protein